VFLLLYYKTLFYPADTEIIIQEEHHHGKDFVKKLGGAAVFGAGATAGADAVNAIIH